MKHLFLCREYSPTAYPPGGIGTCVRHMTSLLARAGETVHVIAHRWDGAPDARQESVGGRLIVHRVALDEPILDKWAISQALGDQQVPRGLLASSFPSQAFSWQAALLAERLIESEGVEVIEAQEWEAPLYYFQLRRALNLGPARRPPCVVHLHSPSEQIFAANGWDTTVADYLPAVALEEYSITAADAILCPSRLLAEQALVRYRIDRSRVSVIPYPLGDAPHLDRSAHTWATGSICHVGRIELRKGVLEWADAVASIADAIKAMEFAIQAKQIFAATGAANVRVLSNSWGGGGFSQALLDEINKVNTHDMLFVAAAGNSSVNTDPTPFYPSSYTAPNVVSVAATTSTDARASFSN